ncbi:HlyD family efflux transporter periplasmic adaptor subunit [uncultured Lentibacter sp.]|uniref:HlyD family efflux transporter periplasmic adaptor subunit n=1 Tax=uncultured Lentibacter sp. TaxID=1659309 RepID=UPI002626DD39|nr:HlyD family efflux transporter periplasmic adaptor subunit [uncultured Lentibacter sp.]
MSDPKNDATKLPLTDNGLGANGAAGKPAKGGLGWKLFPLLLVTFFAGGVAGLYFQPPGMKAFFGLTGLEPGGGTDTPIAVAMAQVQAQEQVAVVSEGDIFALGRVLPDGDVLAVATPFGASDARLQAIEVREGDSVQRGDVLAVLDNKSQLDNALATAEANLRVKEAALLQTQETIRASRAEAQANLERAIATADQAQSELDRLAPLAERGVATQAALDTAAARADEAKRDVERNRATLSRYKATSGAVQADIAVAEANLEAARVDVQRARSDTERALVRAPIDGMVLKVNSQIGEKPATGGIIELGDTRQMMVEAEVYQTMIGRVAIGDPVTVTAEALDGPLTGVVSAIGLEIGRQSITSDDPAANTDARVVDVIVRLDAASSEKAKRLTNLETIVRIDAGRGE